MIPDPPDPHGVERYVSLWSSADERPAEVDVAYAPGDVVTLPGTAMHLFRAE